MILVDFLDPAVEELVIGVFVELPQAFHVRRRNLIHFRYGVKQLLLRVLMPG